MLIILITYFIHTKKHFEYEHDIHTWLSQLLMKRALKIHPKNKSDYDYECVFVLPTTTRSDEMRFED